MSTERDRLETLLLQISECTPDHVVFITLRQHTPRGQAYEWIDTHDAESIGSIWLEYKKLYISKHIQIDDKTFCEDMVKVLISTKNIGIDIVYADGKRRFEKTFGGYFEFSAGDDITKKNATMVFQNEMGKNGRRIHAKIRERTKMKIGEICEIWTNQNRYYTKICDGNISMQNSN